MKRNGKGLLEMNGQSPLCSGVNSEGRNFGNGGSDAGRKIRQSISYMLEHLNRPLQVATLAAAVNVSPSHYSALFKRWMGCPPIDFFIHLRMQRACRLFDSTALNVKEVAAELGYDDPFYFSRTFKAINRIAPSQYRMMPQEKRHTIKSASRPFGISNQEETCIPERNQNSWREDPQIKGDEHADGPGHRINGTVREIESHQHALET